MHNVVISGTGLYTPTNSISNEELVASFNAYVQAFNAENAGAIERGEIEALAESSVAFIEKASGIKSRFVVDKDGILDPERMVPRIPERSNDEWGILCEMAVAAARQALERAGRTPADIDGVMPPYHGDPPAEGFIDNFGLQNVRFTTLINMGGASGVAAIRAAAQAVVGGLANYVLVVYGRNGRSGRRIGKGGPAPAGVMSVTARGLRPRTPSSPGSLACRPNYPPVSRRRGERAPVGSIARSTGPGLRS